MSRDNRARLARLVIPSPSADPLGSCLGRWCRDGQASTPATDHLDPVAASILEPEVPAGGNVVCSWPTAPPS
jgi:hypothetical protein